MQILIYAKADIDVKGDLGQFALHMTSDPKIMRMLMDSKATVDTKNNSSRTPLHDAATAGDCEVPQVLIDAKATVDIKDDEGDTSLACAAMTDLCEAVIA